MNEYEQIKFIAKAYEIAFGDNAISRGYSAEDVLEKLETFSNHALIWEQIVDSPKLVKDGPVITIMGKKYTIDDKMELVEDE